MNQIITIITVAFIALAVTRARAAAETLPTDDTVRKILQERVDAKLAPSIVVGLIDMNGQRIVAVGKTSLENGADADGDTLYEVGSVSKVFTALLLADKVQRGEVQLTDPISKFLPVGAKVPTRKGKEITLLDLAEHRSSLPRLPDNLAAADNNNPYADYSFKNLEDFLADYTLTRDIGSKYEYSNFGMGLLGALLAHKAGTTYEALLTERVLRPLGLHDTVVQLTPALKSRLAAPYNEHLEPDHNWDFDALAGCGGIRSTVRDLMKFVAANMQLTDAALTRAMRLTQEPRAGTDTPRTRIGLAWHMTDRNNKRIIWHNGETGGYHSFIGFDPTNKIGVVVLANSANDIDDIALHLLDSRRALSKPKAPESDKSIQLTGAQLDRYVGQYQLGRGAAFSLRLDGNHLMAQLTGQSYYEIFPKSEKEFFYKVVDAQITFGFDGSGKVKNLTLHQNGVDQIAKKTSDQPLAEHKAIHLDAAVLDRYVGEYQLAPGAAFTLRRNGPRLLARLSGQGFAEIYPESETEFFYKIVDAQLTFEKDDHGKIVRLILHQNGADQTAERTK